MTSDQFVLSQVALLCWRESDGSVPSMEAIALMLRNRQRAGWGSWLELVESYPKHRGNTCPQVTTFPDLRNPAFRLFLQRLDAIHNGMAPDAMTEGALYCAVLHEPLSEWWVQNMAGKRPVATINGFSFFR